METATYTIILQSRNLVYDEEKPLGGGTDNVLSIIKENNGTLLFSARK